MKKDYTNGDLTVRWRPEKCIHSKKCWKELSSVFQPKSRPWINLDGASLEAVTAQVKKCPSGALELVHEDEIDEQPADRTALDVMKNGPLLVKGNLEIKMPDGGVQHKTKITAFCRCGASTNKPYCDGTHIRVSFEG